MAEGSTGAGVGGERARGAAGRGVEDGETRGCGRRTPGCVSCPVSSRRRLILFGEPLEGPVLVGVVGGVGGPALPDDVEPGAGEDADGVGMVVSAGACAVVQV